MSPTSPSWNRRNFLGTTIAGGAALALSPRLAPASALGANDRIRIGVVGTGGRARHMMRLLKELPGCEMVAVSDVYEPRMLEAAEIAGLAAAKHPDYRRLLEDKDVHAVVVGSPDHWHLKMTADAIAAGKDVYLEKPVSRTLEDGDALLKLALGTKQVVQTGTQQRSWEHFALGKEIVDSGKLGQVTFVHTYWHQRMGKGAWPEVDLAKLDWKAWLGPAPSQPWNPERFFRPSDFSMLPSWEETLTMVRPADPAKAVSRLVELLGIGREYPLYGSLALEGGRPYSHRLPEGRGLLVRPELLAQLDVSVGDDVMIGEARFTIRGVVLAEPGRRAGAFTFGTRAFVDRRDLEGAGLLGFGSRATYRLLLKMPEGDAEQLARDLRQALRNQFVSVRTSRSTGDPAYPAALLKPYKRE